MKERKRLDSFQEEEMKGQKPLLPESFSSKNGHKKTKKERA